MLKKKNKRKKKTYILGEREHGEIFPIAKVNNQLGKPCSSLLSQAVGWLRTALFLDQF